MPHYTVFCVLYTEVQRQPSLDILVSDLTFNLSSYVTHLDRLDAIFQTVFCVCSITADFLQHGYPSAHYSESD